MPEVRVTRLSTNRACDNSLSLKRSSRDRQDEEAFLGPQTDETLLVFNVPDLPLIAGAVTATLIEGNKPLTFGCSDKGAGVGEAGNYFHGWMDLKHGGMYSCSGLA